MLMTCNGDIWFRDMWGETCWYINWSVSSMLTSLSTPLTGLNLLVIPIIQVQTSSMRRFYSQWSLQAERKILRRHDRRKDLVFWSVADLTSRQTVDLQGATTGRGRASEPDCSLLYISIISCLADSYLYPFYQRQSGPDQSRPVEAVSFCTNTALTLSGHRRKEGNTRPPLAQVSNDVSRLLGPSRY